ncbi:cytochrome b5 domain-containing protein [Thermococcus sp.]|uniref:cytochrome b5 domain-containing protein n=1 Tax=Thermococcus sp. TaxID=35749 RepID=UPI0025ED09A9|nr:cytochrome b5 domain-containing protein [Thermococcus sp.]
MKRVTKVLIASGELLIAASLALMVTGLAMNDPASTLGSLMSYETARRVHTIASYLFIPLFYVHATAGIYIAFGRFESLKRPEVRRAVLSTWTLGIAVLILLAIVSPGSIFRTSSVSATPVLTLAEVAKHNSSSDCWVIVEDRAYNVTSLIDTHPGGREAILKYCGTNATEVFFLEHNQNDYEVLQAYYIGRIGEPLNTTKNR